MKCPACEKEMVEKNFGGVMVDVCENGCKGIWFDWCELSKLDETSEGAGKALNEALDVPAKEEGDRGQIKCPKCGLAMHVHKYQCSKEVDVDECYACGGFFLDAGELSLIRDSFMDEKAQEEFAEKLVNSVPEYARAEMDHEKAQARVAAVKRMTRFVRLSSVLRGR
jgi:Zn-finger nucleic acid-binding protein